MSKIKEFKKKTLVTMFIMALALSAILGAIPSASAQEDAPLDIQVNITLSNDKPMEGEEITIYVTVLNNESMRLDNLTINIFHGENIENATRMLVTLDAKESVTVNTTWVTEKWGQSVAVIVGIGDDNALLLNTMAFKEIWVEENPIGDIPTLIFALVLIIVAIFVIAMVPSLLEWLKDIGSKR